MNSRLINIVLGAIIIGLLGTILFMVSLAKERQVPEVLDRTNYVANTVTQITVKKFNATNLLAALANRTLSWSAIESTNYLAYVMNLRSIGCPEETIRDIIVADVAKLYARQREAILANAPSPEYWRTRRAGESNIDPSMQRQLQALEDEKRQLLRDLLRVNYDAEIAKFDPSNEPVSRLRGVFPMETRQQIQGVMDDYDRMIREIRINSGGYLLPEEEAKVRELERQRDEQISQLLTPEQYQTYELYASPLAESMRQDLFGFNPSAEEFVEIFELRKAYDQLAQGTVASDAMAQIETSLQSELQAALGQDRYLAYTRITDPNYQELLRLNERLQIPDGAIDQVYTLRTSVEQQKLRILANTSLTLDQRQTALAAISQATEKVMVELMGDEALNTYLQSGGEWLAQLGEVPANAIPVAVPEPVPVLEYPPLPQATGPQIGDPVPPNAPFPFYQPPIVPPPPPLPNPVPQ